MSWQNSAKHFSRPALQRLGKNSVIGVCTTPSGDVPSLKQKTETCRMLVIFTAAINFVAINLIHLSICCLLNYKLTIPKDKLIPKNVIRWSLNNWTIFLTTSREHLDWDHINTVLPCPNQRLRRQRESAWIPGLPTPDGCRSTESQPVKTSAQVQESSYVIEHGSNDINL